MDVFVRQSPADLPDVLVQPGCVFAVQVHDRLMKQADRAADAVVVGGKEVPQEGERGEYDFHFQSLSGFDGPDKRRVRYDTTVVLPQCVPGTIECE